MPRKARLRLPGYPLHVVQRGHNRAPCFFAPDDYGLYLALLAENAKKHGCAVHAFVLMTNHVHLLVSEGELGATTGLMRGIGQRYVQFINRHYGKTGSLWEGRFHTSIVQSDRYFLACQRYIELNPCRAHMVRQPQEYVWSSHAHNALGAPSGFLQPHDVYLGLGSTEQSRRDHYQALFDEPIAPDELAAIRLAIKSGLPLGTDAFREEVAARLGRPTRLMRRVFSARKSAMREEGPSPSASVPGGEK